jgi:hypothetical protein
MRYLAVIATHMCSSHAVMLPPSRKSAISKIHPRPHCESELLA